MAAEFVEEESVMPQTTVLSLQHMKVEETYVAVNS